MQSVPTPQHASPGRVVIVRALPGLGDLLCTVPALRALRAALPDAHITLVGLPTASGFVQRFDHLLDELLAFPGYPGIPERGYDPARFMAFLREAHARHFDLAVQMHGSGLTSNPFTVLLGAERNAGFYVPGNYCPDAELFLPFDEQESEVLRYIRLVGILGFPSQGEELEFPLHEQDFRDLARIEEARSLRPGEYICVHPGAKDPARRWPPAHFASIADRLSDEGLRVVLTGTESERKLTASVARLMKAKAIDLAGQTGLGALAALLSNARLLVCNDTGVSHLAAALRVPSVVVFTSTDPARWAPLDGDRHRAVLASEGPGASLSHAQDLLGVPVYTGGWS